MTTPHIRRVHNTPPTHSQILHEHVWEAASTNNKRPRTQISKTLSSTFATPIKVSSDGRALLPSCCVSFSPPMANRAQALGPNRSTASPAQQHARAEGLPPNWSRSVAPGSGCAARSAPSTHCYWLPPCGGPVPFSGTMLNSGYAGPPWSMLSIPANSVIWSTRSRLKCRKEPNTSAANAPPTSNVSAMAVQGREGVEGQGRQRQQGMCCVRGQHTHHHWLLTRQPHFRNKPAVAVTHAFYASRKTPGQDEVWRCC